MFDQLLETLQSATNSCPVDDAVRDVLPLSAQAITHIDAETILALLNGEVIRYEIDLPNKNPNYLYLVVVDREYELHDLSDTDLCWGLTTLRHTRTDTMAGRQVTFSKTTLTSPNPTTHHALAAMTALLNGQVIKYTKQGKVVGLEEDCRLGIQNGEYIIDCGSGSYIKFAQLDRIPDLHDVKRGYFDIKLKTDTTE